MAQRTHSFFSWGKDLPKASSTAPVSSPSRALTPNACRVDLEMDYEMRSGLIARLLGPVFDQIAQSMVDAFVSRAEALSSEP